MSSQRNERVIPLKISIAQSAVNPTKNNNISEDTLEYYQGILDGWWEKPIGGFRSDNYLKAWREGQSIYNGKD